MSASTSTASRSRKLLSRTIALIAAAIVGLLAVPTSSAAVRDGNVYVVVRDSACGVPGSHARGILYNSETTGDTSASWDNGDNIVYPRVRLNADNRITMQVRCERRQYFVFWQTVGFRSLSDVIHPTADGQTFWVG